jgi:hypothetical protein
MIVDHQRHEPLDRVARGGRRVERHIVRAHTPS